MKIRMILLMSLIFGLLTPAIAWSHAKPIRGGVLVSTNWLETRLDHPDLLIVHVETTLDAVDHYANEHIPGARFLAMEDLAIERGGVNGMLPPLDTLIELVRDLGIGDDTKKVVIYGATNPWAPARFFQVLDYLGFGDRAALLDGHFPRWQAEGRPTTTNEPVPIYSYFVPSPNPRALTGRGTIGDLMGTLALRRTLDPSLDGSGFVLLDTRLDAAYRSGHIPGAVQANPLPDFIGMSAGGADPLTRWRLHPRRTVVKRYNGMGLDKRDLAITSCNTGIAGSLLYFILRYAGFEVTLYDGSMNEWSAVAIEDRHELDIWREVYPDYPNNHIGKLPVVTGPGRW